ncbi:hypothetical protein [Ulvibacterium marinum]|uniref:PRTRC system protein B n=1 Tax=Ulvibacterium marinum TaxID=2419782 RepID=A0A3B0CFQ8_9FLAO|nr:hypothetical protein [Ulvibacterium marinum]RKN83554.1 hypothetical protein D7Z94_06975 [Ulvibacterium marinum]
MEHVTILQADEHFLPKFAIIGYSQDQGYYTQGHYFSYHNIVGEKLTAGMPLTKDTARNVFSCLEGDLIKFRFKGMLPKNLIHFDFKGSLQLVWYVHPKQHTMYFDTNTGIVSGKYPLPKLLFKLEGNTLRVFALLRKDSLNESTPIYNAPLLNVDGHGKVCMGSASMEYDGFEYYEDIMGFVEQQFFRSVFTATHHNRIAKGNIVAIMKSHLDKPFFDDGLLIANKLTIKDLYEN